ncbi:outer membrane beta-barrel family protein [Chitinophaga nivalis]|uniref:TonB-dependent receptor family protein n=1 Tax=Chitinophaga nivalis TaxID=2991709 RepID=A0ABT3INZ0_9BACT|nr:outer membrane beta-barrel family protein [Chitinophaga nivalis]MCW3464693.1 TonB-dependent receptor family protein [Chitinophaga nivalis]MCW3485616.1 TonB-dependent receptor family protein [Chitinophaga nivalis]
MMLKSIPLLLLCCCVLVLHAQQLPTVVTGQVADSNTRKPVEYATVVLIQAHNQKNIAHVQADNNGNFMFSGVAYGAYQVGISMLGYAPRVVDTFHLDSLHLTHRVGTRFLSPTAQQLSGVTVKGKRPLVEIKDDRLVYNVENDIDKDVAAASDIMRKIPMITVEADGTIKLRGQTNYKVLMNGRATSIVTKNPKDALRGFPASIIKRIEILTEPSAKYDAEGIGGIINIITKKNIIGYNGSIYTNYDTRGSGSGGGTISAKQGKFGLTAFANVNGYKNRSTSESMRESYVPGNKNTLQQSSSNQVHGLSGTGNLELNYDIDSTNFLTVYGGLNKGNSGNFSPQDIFHYDSLRHLTQSGYYTSENKSNSSGLDLGLDYQHKFKKPDHEFSFVANMNSSLSNSYTDNQQRNQPGTDSFYRNNNIEKNREINLQTDYSLPLRKGQKLEMGAKAVFRHVSSNYEQLIRNKDGEYIVNPARANIFQYDQNILALYATYRFKIGKKMSTTMGARLEKTFMKGEFISNNTDLASQYLNLIPTISINRQFKSLNAIVFSYSRRLQRPWIYNLNPYVNDNDPNNISYGNPNLKPAFTNSFGLYYNCMLKTTSLNIGADYSFSNNNIQNITTLDTLKGVTYTTFDNIGKTINGGISVSARVPLTSKWNIGFNGRLNYSRMETGGTANLKNSGFNVNGYMNTDYDLGRDFRADAYFYCSSGSPSLQGSTAAAYGYGFTIRKEFLHKKASVTFTADQPFRNNGVYSDETRDPNFYRSITTYTPANAYSFGFSWRFGKLQEAVSRKKGVSNSDR